MTKPDTKVRKRAKRALWKKSGLAHDRCGYVRHPEENFIPGVISGVIKEDYSRGSGQEWQNKIRAIHSSAALAANSFGRWRSDPAKLTFADAKDFTSLQFEAQCPSGLRGTPPNLDVLLESPEIVIGIESKLLEPITPKAPEFSPNYSRDKLPLCEDAWWSLLESVRQWSPSHLDAAQLIKHYLGLRKQFTSGRKVLLVYLFWKPLNACDFEEYLRHAEDLAKFGSMVEGATSVRFMALDYLQLWDAWEKDGSTAEHARNLKNRYSVEI